MGAYRLHITLIIVGNKDKFRVYLLKDILEIASHIIIEKY